MIRGSLVNFDHEVLLWDEIMKSLLKTNENSPQIKNKELLLNLTFPLLIPNKIREKVIEVIFEYYGFGGFYPVNSSDMIREYALETYPSNIDRNFNVVLESSNASTYCAPYFDNECMNYAIKKVDIGGRLLTNYLKETITFRYLNVSNDFQTLNNIKEQLCFISQDFNKDIKSK